MIRISWIHTVRGCSGEIFIRFMTLLGILFVMLVPSQENIAKSDWLLSCTLLGFSVLLLFSMFFKIGNMPRWQIFDTLVLLWWVYITLSYLFVSSVVSNTLYLRYSMYFLLYGCLRVLLFDIERYHYLFMLFIVTIGLYQAVWGNLQIYGIVPSTHKLFAVTGTFFNPAPYAGCLAVVAVIGTCFLKEKFLYKDESMKVDFSSSFNTGGFILSWYIIITLILTVIILPVTWSRAAFLALVIGLLCVFYSKYKKYCKWNVLCVGIVILLSICVGLYMLKKDSVHGRLFIWYISILILFSKWMLGVGIGGFFRAFGEVQGEYLQQNIDSLFVRLADVPFHSFNELLWIGVEQGMLGVLFVITMVGYISYRLYAKEKALFYGWITLLLFSMFSYPFQTSFFRILLILFVVYAISSTNNAEGQTRYRFSGFHRVVAAVFASVVGCLVIFMQNRKDAIDTLESIRGYSSAVFVKEAAKIYSILQDHPQFLFDYGKALSELGKYNESNRVLQQGTLVSGDPMFFVLMGNNYQSLRAYNYAQQAYDHASFLLPNRVYPLYKLMLLYQKIYREKEAKVLANKILNMHIKSPSPATDEICKKAKEVLLLNK